MKKLALAFFTFHFSFFTLLAQTDSVNRNPVFTLVQQMPRYNGDITKFLTEHLAYPQAAMDKGVQGTVYVTFVVEKDGSLSGISIRQGLEHSLDSAAMACIRSMPKWIAGMRDGQKVRVQYSIPLQFNLPTIEPSSVNPATPPRIKN